MGDDLVTAQGMIGGGSEDSPVVSPEVSRWVPVVFRRFAVPGGWPVVLGGSPVFSRGLPGWG